VKVEEGSGANAGAARRAPGAKRFGDALRKAAGSPRSGGAQKVASPSGGASLAAARTSAARRTSADRADDALRSRRDAFREETRLAPPPPPAAARPPDAVTVPELRAVVRTLPLAIQTLGVREGAPLALSFGRSLDVEIRSAPRGLELVLRPEPRLARATEAELRGVVAALAAKGIAVARAEVRVRGAREPGEPAPRVDLSAGLR
jgi:hypothetical protein